MAQIVPFSSASSNGGTASLLPREPMQIDTRRLRAVCDAHGAAAEETIAAALFRIEERLILASWQIEKFELGGLRRTATELVDLSGELGLVSLEQAAGAVIEVLDRPDPAQEETTLAAVAARLARMGQAGSLGHWDLTGDSGPDGFAS
ncbi:hypothetical protein [Jannaschia aquimarina]|uniref:Uncharacterized protein n=1 Tax=Jannaschia aquimarina TaxID=935700 RepID=A0A0D1EJ47_9RHOB|nr:hypothetical protein [Jannaschia aquimarina]KIT16991.1 hypothetical protein jaqu_11810 [Jannaschia aquimarina]SNS80985.1 hypothetical protein SAMN05421775_102384 [Jannaschia aquimarina]